MNKIYNFIIILLLCLATSCSDWLDINKDPNKAVDVEPELLYNYAIMSHAGNRCGGDLYIPLGFAAQTLATGGSGGWGDINVYDVSVYSLGNTWKVYYASGGANLKSAIEIAEETGKPNVAAQCKIAFVQMIYSATVLHGDIPYFEAWDIDENFYPKFDAQKDILEDLIKTLDEAVAQFDSSNPLIISDYDLAYKGDIDKWIRYANSLKFRIAMTMVDKDPSKAALIGELLAANNMINEAAGGFIIPFSTESGKENPKYKILKNYMNGVNQEFFANESVLNPLKESNDPRIDKYFDLGKAKDEHGEVVVMTEHVGVGTNVSVTFGKASMISAYLYRPEAPDIFFSYQEQLLLEAEAYTRGLGVAKDLAKANEKYKAALIAAMKFYEVSQEDIDKYVAENLVDLRTLANPLKEIYTQQWIDLMDRPLEAFTMWRRSGKQGEETPALTVPSKAVPGELMRRWKYSPDEASANPNTPESDVMTTKLWFDE